MRAGRRKGVTDTKLGRRSGAGTRFFRFGGAAQPELVGQVGGQEKLGAAVCGPFRVATVGLGAGRAGEAEPGLALALLLTRSELPCAPRGLGGNGGMREKGRCAEITAVCISVPFFLSPASSEIAVPVLLLLPVLPSYFPRLRCSWSSRACLLCSELHWDSGALADA